MNFNVIIVLCSIKRHKIITQFNNFVPLEGIVKISNCKASCKIVHLRKSGECNEKCVHYVLSGAIIQVYKF